MAGATLVRPDKRFVEELIASGGGDLKKCFQCATCSAVCDLSDGGPPFPRKEMIWAQWGLKDRLLTDPDIWLCHQCNDCSKRCPRGARPGDVLAAVRRTAIQHLAVPRFFARWVSEVKLVPVTFLLPVALLAVALLLREPIQSAMSFHEHPGFYADFFPHWLLIGFYGLFTGAAALVSLLGIVRLWKGMKTADREAGRYEPVAGVVPSLFRALTSLAAHDRFGSCDAQASRKTVHLTAFYGFLALYVVTLWAVVDIYVNPRIGIESMYPFGLMHPMKMLANVGGVLLIFGATKAILDRRREGPGTAGSTSFDWIFVWTLLGVGVTGFLVEIFRFALEPTPGDAVRTLAYAVYFVHLALVFHLLVYLPYSKFAHLIYRFTAMVYAEHTGRHRAVGRMKNRTVTA